jgi:hypothetical protein
MNIADTALAQGFDGLLAIAGDTVTFRGVSVSAVIDWTPFEEKPPGSNLPDFDEQSTSRIEIKTSAVASTPIVGEIITTTGPVYHRIAKVKFNGSAWILECEVNL